MVGTYAIYDTAGFDEGCDLQRRTNPAAIAELYRPITVRPGWRNQPLDLLHAQAKNQECLGSKVEGFPRHDLQGESTQSLSLSWGK